MADRPKLLLVEDEPLIRDLLEMVLSEAGFDTVSAAAGQEAIERLRTGANDFRGMITDVRLSDGHSGWDLARLARTQLPGIAVVYVTGDGEADWSSKGAPGSVLIVKPFAPAQVIAAISSLLSQPPRT
jgi:CheY-like chemotaxis protein